MRIGLVIYGSLETLSGGYLYDRRLVQALRERGHRVEVISQPWGGYARRLLHNLDARWTARMAGLDVLLQDELNHPSLFWLNWRLKRAFDRPILSIVHHLRSSEDHSGALLPLYRRIERAYLRSVDGFIFNSHTTCAAVEHLAGTAGRPVVVATPAGDRFGEGLCEAEIIRRVRRGGPLRLLFVGNVTRRKGLHTLLRALATLPEESWRLRVAGRLEVEPGYAREMAELSRRSGIQGQVAFLGGLDDHRLQAELAAADALAVPSQYEGFGIVYLEGMAFGLPAIATTGGGAGEIIEDGVSGILVPPGDWQALAERLGGLLVDRERLLALSLAARRRFAAFPGWEESMGRVAEFMANLSMP